jgi:hypothetical protein
LEPTPQLSHRPPRQPPNPNLTCPVAPSWTPALPGFPAASAGRMSAGVGLLPQPTPNNAENPMESKFDPDDIDVTGDPQYQIRTEAPGPMNRILWAPVGEASRAKRAEMFLIDAEMTTRWMDAMQKLLEQDLDDAQFTIERMLRLKLWEKERKRRQHNLHYKYDPSRRRPALVQRDSKRTLQDLAKRRAQIEEGLARMRARIEAQTVPEPVHDSMMLGQGLRERSARVNKEVLGEKPEHLDEGTFKMIVEDTGIVDPVNATDEKILQAYEARGQGGYSAEYFLALLRGRELPARPDELG